MCKGVEKEVNYPQFQYKHIDSEVWYECTEEYYHQLDDSQIYETRVKESA